MKPLSFTIYLEIVLSIKSANQKHGGFDVTVSLFSWGHPTELNRWAIRTEHALTLARKRPGKFNMAEHERSVFVKLFVIKQHFNEQRRCILLLEGFNSCTQNVLNSKEGILLLRFAFYVFKTCKLISLKTSILLLLNI